MPSSTTTTRTTTTKPSKTGPRAWTDPAYYADPRNATLARSILDPAQSDYGAMITEAQFQQQQVVAQASMMGPGALAALQDVLDTSPTVSAGTAAALALVGDRLKLPTEVTDQILAADATVRAADPATAGRNPNQGSEAERGGLATALSEITRPMFALASMPYELVIGAVRSLVDDITSVGDPGYQRESAGSEIAELFSQSTGAQYIRGLVDPNLSADLGEGWVPRGDVAARQVQAARDAGPLIHGHAWTLGRGVASMIHEDPDSLQYQQLSGLIDLGANVLLDPFVILGKSAAATRAVRGAAEEAGRRGVAKLIVAEQAEVVSRETMEAANAATRDIGQRVAAAQQKAAEALGREDPDLVARADQLLDRKARLTADRANPRDHVPGEHELMMDEARRALGDEALDATTASSVGKSPELPGPFTEVIPTPGTSQVLPGSDDGVDAILRIDTETPVLRSVDDMINEPGSMREPGSLRASITAQVGGSKNRTAALGRLAAIASEEGASYGDLLGFAADSGIGGLLRNALREEGIDGITDVFRLTDNEGGVWWTTQDITVTRNTPDGFRAVDRSAAGVDEGFKRLAIEEEELAKAATQAARKKGQLAGAYTRLSNRYAEVSDARTSAYDRWDAAKYALEVGFGMLRRVDGKPEISTDLVREALVSPRPSFDGNVAAHVPTSLKAAELANRAMTGVMTLGVSELARAGKRSLVDPFIVNVRNKIISDMAILPDTAENLGRLQRLTGGRMPTELLRSVLKAQSEDEVLGILGPALGVDITRPISPSVLTAQRIRMSQLTTGRAGYHIFRKAQQWMIDQAEQYGTVAPRVAVHLNLADPQGSAMHLRNYLTNLPTHNVGMVDQLVGNYLRQTTETGRANAVRKALDNVADELAQWTRDKRGVSEKTADELAAKLKTATRIYEGGRSDVNNWWLDRARHDSNLGYMTSDGQLIHLVGPQLEAELARGGMVLPSMSNIRDASGRWGQLLEAHPSSEYFRDAADWGMDLWRSSVLFRFAYTVRNIAEMQFRMFLTGHRSIFSHPLGAVAAASALNKRNKTSKGLMARFASYNKTADGKTLAAIGSDDLDALEDSFASAFEVLTRTGSSHDPRTLRNMVAHHGVREVRADQPEFVSGWADEIYKLHSDRVARIVAGLNPPGIEADLARGVSREDAIVKWLMTHDGANGIRREYTEAIDDMAQIFADPKALRQFLFDSEVSIQARIHEYTIGGDQELLDLVAHGVLGSPDAPRFAFSTRGIDPAEREAMMAKQNSALSAELRPMLNQAPDDLKVRMRTYQPAPPNPRYLGKLFDWFFEWNGRKETAWAMGPEFSYAYNDSLVKMMPALNVADRQKIYDFVRQAESRWRPHSETLTAARANLKGPDGTLNMDDASTVAAREASEHVKGLFYDARNRQQIFHSTRLIFPFAQPFFDTLNRWGRLMAARPYMVEKVGRLFTGLSEPGSGVIYDTFDQIDPFSDRETRDPTQGFIYTHPLTGEQTFKFPLIGSVLGAAFSPLTGFNVAEAQALEAPVANLNLAFQGDVDYLPGLGPMVSFPLAQLMDDDVVGRFPEWLRRYAFPYGEPKPEHGVLESTFASSWVRRLTGALWNEDFAAYSHKGVMAYLVSNREYPGLTSNPQARNQLAEDTKGLARIVTFIRAIGAAVLPAAPGQEFFTADQDGRLIGTAYLAKHFELLKEDSGDDYEAATKAFIDTYGPQALAALVPNTEGDLEFSGPGWEWYKQHKDQAGAYVDILGAFFPGDYSTEAHQFHLNSDSRRSLSVKARTDKMLEFLYNAEKAQIEGRAATNEWDIATVEQANEDLKTRYGGVTPAFRGISSADRLEKVRQAIDTFPDLAATRGGQGADLLFDAYDRHLAMAREFHPDAKTLSGQAVAMWREMFLDELESIAQEFGGDGGSQGSVDTIARYFVNVATPRGQ